MHSTFIRKMLHHKGAIIIDVMIAIIFFALISITMVKVINSTTTDPLAKSQTTFEDLDRVAELAEYKKSVIENVKALIDCGAAAPNSGTIPCPNLTADSSAAGTSPSGTFTAVYKETPTISFNNLITVSISIKKGTTEVDSFEFTF